MKMNEEATFAVYQKKLKGICEENDLQATFNRSGYPLTMTVRPLQDVADQMSMLEKVEDNGYTSPDASIKFSYEDGTIKYTLSKEFVISDALFTNEEPVPQSARHLAPVFPSHRYPEKTVECQCARHPRRCGRLR